MSSEHETVVERGKSNGQLADSKTPLIRNCWYVAAMAGEITRELRARTILDRKIVLYRKEDGGVVALQDRCAHRSFPLSKSTLKGDNVVCGYHGIIWAPDGRCVRIPSQSTCPSVVRVKSYPVVEKGPLIWIWMGAPEKAREKDVPEFSWFDSKATVGHFHLKCNYLLMHENLMDLSHFSYLHGSTLGAEGFAEERAVMLNTDDDTVQYYREIRDNPVLAGVLPMKLQEQLKGKKTVNRNSVCFVSPAFTTGVDKITAYDSSGAEVLTTNMHIAHFLTPETQNTTHYYWAGGRDFAQSDSKEDREYLELMSRLTEQVFAQDKEAGELIQSMSESDCDPDFVERHVAGDKMGVAMRRVILKLANQE